MSENTSEKLASYKPGAFYFRRSLRLSKDVDEAREIGLVLCNEYEHLREWVREQGMIPPKWLVDPEEAKAKGWGRYSKRRQA